jgi:hypothetical protein
MKGPGERFLIATAAMASLASLAIVPGPSLASEDPDQCTVRGWGDPPDGKPVAVRRKPSGGARIIGHIPVDADGQTGSPAAHIDRREVSEFIVHERRGHWVRIGDTRIVTLADASWEARKSDLAGWIPADSVRFSVEYAHIHAAPSRSGTILFSAQDLILGEWSGWEDCKSNWAEIRLTKDNISALSHTKSAYTGPVKGWVTSICGSTMTGCDYPDVPSEPTSQPEVLQVPH